MKKKNILIVAAHPDDEVLGCGATVARLVKEGYHATTLILGEGVTARDEKRNRERREYEIAALKAQIQAANRIIGVKDVLMYDFPDNRFDQVPLLDIVKVIEKAKYDISPEIIFTHYEKDLNIDHRVTYQAVVTATRPVKGEAVKEIYSFEVFSSTEWAYPLSFSPDVFFDVTGSIKFKMDAIKIYKSELRGPNHPRSLKNIKLTAEYWGLRTGLEMAEVFKAVRIIK